MISLQAPIQTSHLPRTLAILGLVIVIVKIGIITFAFKLSLLSGVNMIIPITMLLPLIPSYFLFKGLVGYKETGESSAILSVVHFAQGVIGVYILVIIALITKTIIGPNGESTDVEESILGALGFSLFIFSGDVLMAASVLLLAGRINEKEAESVMLRNEKTGLYYSLPLVRI